MEVTLSDNVKLPNGQVIADLSTVLAGDGATPLVQTISHSAITGYTDDGSPTVAKVDDDLIAEHQKIFMAKAIKVQKMLTSDNGLDPNQVNTFHSPH